MASASKDYTQPTGLDRKDLYWPNTKDLHDLLRIDIVEYLPISRSSVGQNTKLEFITNIQQENTILDRFEGGSKPRNRNTLSTVLLPIPNDINYSDQLTWDNESLGILGKMAPALAGGALTDQSGLGSKLSQLASSGTPEVILSEIGKVATFSPSALTQGIGGKILNPYQEQIFKGIAMRDFNFSWKLVPRNAIEQSRIHGIIKNLRFYSLPNYSSRAGVFQDNATQDVPTNNLSDRWLSVPHIFNLKWVQAGTDSTTIQSLPKIKPCVLKSVTVNYTPDNVWATHISTSSTGLSGPAPVAYELSLNFTETEIITANDVSGGY